MPILVTTDWAYHAGALNHTRPLDVQTGPLRKLVAAFATDVTNQTVGNVRWGGAAGIPMTLIGAVNATQTTMRVYELPNPAEGQGDLYFETNNAGATAPVASQALVISGAEQAAISNIVPFSSPSNTTATVMMTGAADSLLMLFAANAFTSGSASSPDGELLGVPISGNQLLAASAHADATGVPQPLSVVFSSSSRVCALGAEIVADVTAPPPPPSGLYTMTFEGPAELRAPDGTLLWSGE